MGDNMNESIYEFLANATAFVHLLYVLFVVLGQIFIIIGAFFFWPIVRNATFRIIHFIMIAIVAVQEILGEPCPLTTLEYYFRRLAGQRWDTDLTFLMRIVRTTTFIQIPDWGYTLMYIGFAVIVLGTLILIPPKFNKNPFSKVSLR